MLHPIPPRSLLLIPLLSLVPPVVAAATQGVVVPDAFPAAVVDQQAPGDPGQVQLQGWLGQRIAASAGNRLVKLDPAVLLDGYRHRPGKQAWDGEHVGKWLHAATLAWVYNGDPDLRAKLDLVVTELLKCQLEDGYLGTYTPDQRWTSWDVWSHKYNLLGLLTYVRYTGNTGPLENCRRMGDLLCRAFGEEPGQLNIVKSGWHTGLASSSVLEPMALLHRLTGETRYLAFCRYVLRATEGPAGPRIVSTLLGDGRVDHVGNAKAYELLSCLNGVLELYRTTGDADLLAAATNAWSDISRHRLYLTGAASYRELFRDDHDLPNTDNVGETCVTVTWLQLNAQLLRLTGEARFADEIERVTLNQLLGAQKPDGTAWGYYVQMQGRKPYSASLTGHCCLSSGPRGLALIPTFALAADATGLVVNLYDAGTGEFTLRNGTAVAVKMDTLYPAEGAVRIEVSPGTPAEFELKLRIPSWCTAARITINGEAQAVPEPGYARLRRTWKKGDVIDVNFDLQPRRVMGDHVNEGKAALLYGPLVLAADSALLGDGVDHPGRVVIAAGESRGPALVPTPAPDRHRTWPGARVFRVPAGILRTAGSETALDGREIALVPFADAGATGSRYQVWLPVAAPTEHNVLTEGTAILSQPTEHAYTVNDDDLNTVARLRGSAGAAESWFGVSLPQPVTVRRFTFAHGRSLKSAGWFDTSSGPPVIEIQREVNGPWQRAGTFDGYPATTATNGKALQQLQNHELALTAKEAQRINHAQTFSLVLPKPETVVGVRVVGRASRPTEGGAFELTCAELQAFTR